MHVERTFTVPQPPDAVFDYLGDFTHTNEWDPGTVETTRTSGDGGVGHDVRQHLGVHGAQGRADLRDRRPRRGRARVQFRGTNK